MCCPPVEQDSVLNKTTESSFVLLKPSLQSLQLGISNVFDIKTSHVSTG